MNIVKKKAGLLRSVRNWGVLGLVLALAVAFGSFEADASVQTINLNTGFDQWSNSLIPFGGQDNEWRVIVDPGNGPIPMPPTDPAYGRPANVVDNVPGYFNPQTTTMPQYAPYQNSQWISIRNDRSGIPSQDYKYEFHFTLPPGFSSPTLTMNLNADNYITSVDLNACNLFLDPSGQGLFNGIPKPIITSASQMNCFRPGPNVNYLTVTVHNKELDTALIAAGTVTYLDCDRKPIAGLANLKTITFFESTVANPGDPPTPKPFLAADPKLSTRLTTNTLLTITPDFVGVPAEELYDVFYSDWAGNPISNGEFITIEAIVPNYVAPKGGGLNIAAVRLDFSNGAYQYANFVSSFVALGDNAIPIDVGKAVDGNLLTDTTMGNTFGTSQRLRVTVGFPCPCTPAPPGMVAWWPLDELNGAATVVDIQGGDNNGTAQLGPLGSGGPFHVAGAVDGALYFIGPTTFVEVPDAPGNLDFGTGDFSIDAWVNPVQVGPDIVQPIVDKLALVSSPAGGVGYRLFIMNGFLHFLLLDGLTSVDTPAPITPGQWHHVAVVRKGGSPTNTTEVYIDGQFVNGSSPVVGSISNSASLLIGGIVNSPATGGLPPQFGYGAILIDELEIFNVPLLQSDINKIYLAGSGGKCKGKICGVKFNDLNGNGKQDAGEPGLPGWTIQVTDASGNIIATVITGLDGKYCIEVPAGTYTISEVQQPGWTQTFPAAPGTYTVTIGGSQTIDLSFGNMVKPCVQPPLDMVGWWPMDEQAGATMVTDIWGSNHGTPQPGPVGGTGPSPSAGMVDGALNFNGATQFVRVPDGPGNLDFGTGDFSIDAWIQTSATSGLQPIVDKREQLPGDIQPTGYMFFVLDGQLGIQLTVGSTFFNYYNQVGPASYVATGSPVHVAATVRRSINPQIVLYVNGISVLTNTTPLTASISNSADLLIGRHAFQQSFFMGWIDELEIFNRALDPADVLDIYSALGKGKCKSDLGDAPDSTNHFGIAMTTYGSTNTPAHFPTVYDAATGLPQGPLHRNARGDVWLGPQIGPGAGVTLEGEADQGWDQDVNVNNIRPNLTNTGTPDLDKADDGLLPFTLPACGPATLQFKVSSAPGAVPGNRFVNIWFDFDHNGKWGDQFTCPGTVIPVDEWAVQNQVISVTANMNSVTLPTPSFTSYNPSISPFWMRITITDVPLGPGSSRRDGSGPLGGYLFGETEDYYLEVNHPQAVCDLAMTKEVTPNPVQSGGTVTFKLTVQNVGGADCPPDQNVLGAPSTLVRDLQPTGLVFNNPVAVNEIPPTTNTNTAFNGWVVLGPQPCAIGTNVQNSVGLFCYNFNTLPAGYTATFTYTATVTAAPGSSIKNCASVINSSEDTNLGNNESCVTINATVAPPPCCIDLALIKTLDGTLNNDQQAIYTLTVTNVGQQATSGTITVLDPLPDTLALVSFDAPGWSCFNFGNLVTCLNSNVLAPGQSSTIHITVKLNGGSGKGVPSGTEIKNCASVNVDGDQNADNNVSCVTAKVQ
jgi:uncharacterized repeat protein (TIGR01451 family)